MRHPDTSTLLIALAITGIVFMFLIDVLVHKPDNILVYAVCLLLAAVTAIFFVIVLVYVLTGIILYFTTRWRNRGRQ